MVKRIGGRGERGEINRKGRRMNPRSQEIDRIAKESTRERK
ncbi:hypothetical protein ACUL41_05535 [Virgibacillus natechei]